MPSPPAAPAAATPDDITEYPRGGGASVAGATAGAGAPLGADVAPVATDGEPVAGSGPLPVVDDAGTAIDAAPIAPVRLAAPGMGLLTISAIPRAQVIVDGRYIRYSPLFRYEVGAGARVVTLITDDGRKTTFKADVPDGGEARRVWSFEEGGFIGQ